MSERLVARMEDAIISMFAHGMSNRDIEEQMRTMYEVDVSPEMVSRITDKVVPKAKEWQSRTLDPLYPIIFLDGIMFNVRQGGHVVKKTAYVVFAITVEGGARKFSVFGSAKRNRASSG